ncbi:MAG: DUF4259 domain-containing protein [Gordonia sp. (in: high G+C Gram-positive bacteria)]|uniref:DUF4259 domain-containing protein n=1 Tax=Gordonia sp. (in: high G+C Gram-positive bacteria) TaxID=84139 RepID=UPI0039E3B3B8
MGAWDTGVFDNDDALDWVEEYRGEEAGTPALDLIVATIDEVVGDDAEEYVEMDAASRALAAIAVLARAHAGDRAPALPVGIDPIDPPAGEVGPDLRRRAAEAVERILGEESEWTELWSESDAYPNARAAVSELLAALAP